MNAGSDYHKARKQAQANANLTNMTWKLFSYGGVWWVERAGDRTMPNPSWSGVAVEFIEPVLDKGQKGA